VLSQQLLLLLYQVLMFLEGMEGWRVIIQIWEQSIEHCHLMSFIVDLPIKNGGFP
jgi:hypothetical protein